MGWFWIKKKNLTLLHEKNQKISNNIKKNEKNRKKAVNPTEIEKRASFLHQIRRLKVPQSTSKILVGLKVSPNAFNVSQNAFNVPQSTSKRL